MAKMTNLTKRYTEQNKCCMTRVTFKAENESTKQIDKILELIEDGKEDHDERFMSIELNSAYMSEETFRINQVPYVSNQETRKQEDDFRLRKNVISNSFQNFLVKKSKLFPLSDYPNRAHFFLRERTQELCRGEFVRHGNTGCEVFKRGVQN